MNELDILLIRLNELVEVVDKFVIVESLEHHGSTNIKSAVLAENWGLVKPFEHKIKYEVLPKLHPPFTEAKDIWPRENFQRNSLVGPVMEVCSSPSDIWMISDCDEIPRASTVLSNTRLFEREIRSLRQDFFYYNVNNYLGTWNGTCVGTIKKIQETGGPQAVRNGRDHWRGVNDGGWHFSYFGGLEQIKYKVGNFAHSHDNICQEFMGRSDSEISSDIQSRNDIYHRGSETKNYPEWASDDPRLPEYFLKNPDRFKHFMKGSL